MKLDVWNNIRLKARGSCSPRDLIEAKTLHSYTKRPTHDGCVRCKVSSALPARLSRNHQRFNMDKDDVFYLRITEMSIRNTTSNYGENASH